MKLKIEERKKILNKAVNGETRAVISKLVSRGIDENHLKFEHLDELTNQSYDILI